MAELSGHIRITGDRAATASMGRFHHATSGAALALNGLLTRAATGSTEMSALSLAMVGASTAMRGFKSVLSTGIGVITKFLGLAGGLGVAMGFAANRWGNFSKGMAEVSTLLAPGQTAMDKFGAGVRDLTVVSGQAHDVVVNSLYNALSAGIPQDNALDFMRKASDLATGGVTELNVAVDGLTSVMNAYGRKTMGDVDSISAVFFRTMQGGKTTVDRVANSVGQLAPLAANLGVSFEELGSSWVSLTQVGLGTEEATTQIKAILTGLLRPTAQATAYAKEMGFTWDAASNVALVKAHGLAGAIERIQQMTGGATDKLAVLLPNVRALGGAMRLAADEGKAAFDAAMATMPRSVEEAAEVIRINAGKIEADFGFKMQQLKSGLSEIWLSVGEGIVQGLAPNIDSAVEWIRGAAPRFREGAAAFATGIKEGLQRSQIGQTIARMFDTADSQTAWQEMGDLIGKVTGDILGLLERLAAGADTLVEAFGGVKESVKTVFGVWIGVKAVGAIVALKASILALSAASGPAAATMLATWGPVAAMLGGVAAIAGGLGIGYAAGAPLSRWINDFEGSPFDPQFNNKPGFKQSSMSIDPRTGMPRRSTSEVDKNTTAVLGAAMAGNPGAVQTGIQHGIINRIGRESMTESQRAELAYYDTASKDALWATDQAGLTGQTSMPDAVPFQSSAAGGRMVGVIGDALKGGIAGLSAGIRGAIEGAQTTVKVISELEVKTDKDKGGGGRKIRREERGTGPALGPRIALSQYYIVTDEGDVTAIPDDFFFHPSG